MNERNQPMDNAARILADLSNEMKPKSPRKLKYKNKPTTLDGMRFDSKKEADRYGQLKILERAGVIRDLETQPSFLLTVRDVLICRYVADFKYTLAEHDQIIVEDVKSKATKTPAYRIKKKLMLAVHGIDVKEV